ncbi:MAG: deoxyribose-phosphate aldolase [Bacteroidetes bacterium]|nr:deoxyribose-phosphate aldolase [Bacteroidota bacterium]
MTDSTFDQVLAKKIDHTLLKADASEVDILRLCNEARQFEFATVCVNPSWVGLCASLLKESPSRVCTVIGFPLGANRTEVKIKETEFAAADGADEFDMVLHLGRLKGGDFAYVEHDIRQVVQTAKAAREQALVKVILETGLLDESGITDACKISLEAGADFVKTSTGFSEGGGATVEAVRRMRLAVGENAGVKASGGIRTRETARAMIEAGADRIGASASIQLVRINTA